MTREETRNAIAERIKALSLEFDPMHISALVIIGYLQDLKDHQLLDSGYTISETGKKVLAICTELGWVPDDNEILEFVIGMVEHTERPAAAYMLIQYRDNRDGFLKECEELKKQDEKS